MYLRQVQKYMDDGFEFPCYILSFIIILLVAHAPQIADTAIAWMQTIAKHKDFV